MTLDGCVTLDKTQKNTHLLLNSYLFQTLPKQLKAVQNQLLFGMLTLQPDFDTRVSEENNQRQVNPLSLTTVIIEKWGGRVSGSHFNSNSR